MSGLTLSFKVYHGAHNIEVDMRLKGEYEKHVSAFNADVAETLLTASGLNDTYTDGVLTEALKIIMEEEIESGKVINDMVKTKEFMEVLSCDNS